MHIGCSLGDTQTFLATNHDIVTTISVSSVVEFCLVVRPYRGEGGNSSAGEESSNRHSNKEEEPSLPHLHRAVAREQRPSPDSFLQRLDLNERDANNDTPLHRAVRQNKKD